MLATPSSMRRLGAIVASVLVAGSITVGGADAAAAGPHAVGDDMLTGMMVGHVTDGGAPVPGVSITAEGSGGEWQSAVSEADGSYVIEGITPGQTYTLFVYAPGDSTYAAGYVTGRSDSPITPDPARARYIRAHSGSVIVDIPLQRGVSIGGSVVDLEGNPVPGVTITASPPLGTTGGLAWTDASGAFSIAGLVPGERYGLLASTESGNSAYVDEFWHASPHNGPVSFVAGTAETTALRIVLGYTPVEQFTLSPDLDDDGLGELLAVRDGRLVRFAVNGGGAFGPLVGAGALVAAGVDGVVYAPGDWNGDSWADIIVVDQKGDMFLYPGDGAGHVGVRRKIGNGWSGYRVVPAGDLTRDGVSDLLAIDPSGFLTLYAGDGAGGFVWPYPLVGNGWNGYELYATGDITRDGVNDILSVDSAGYLWSYAGIGNGTFLMRTRAGNGWGAYTLAAGADLTGDRVADIIGRDDAAGLLYLYTGNGAGGFPTKRYVGRGW